MPVPFLKSVGQTNRPFRVIELITLLVIASLIVAISLPCCGNGKASSAPPSPAPLPNQPPPASTPATP